MDINATLLVEMVIFLLFFLLTKHFIWPPIVQVLDERRATIEKSLRQADQAQQDLAQAEQAAQEKIHQAAHKAKEIIDNAQKEAIILLNNTKKSCQDRLAKLDIELEQKTKQAHQRAKKKIETEMLQVATVLCQKALDASLDQQTITRLIESQIGAK